MRVFVFNKKQFDQFCIANRLSDENVETTAWNFMFISITDTDQFSESRKPYFKQNHKNVFNLSFDDVEKDGENSYTQEFNTIAFSEKQAKELFNFINKNSDADIAIVHCMAGISRSGAVGLFINDYFDLDYERFKRDNPQIAPNQKVFRLLKNEWYKSLK